VGSDRARISYDKTREYRSVVAQQGRVTLEADVNEEAVIASEALRYETIDIIGPTGTPDNGYLVSVDANGDLIVGPGIMYVGGWRMRFPLPVPVADQPEWIDQPSLPWIQNPKQSLYVIALLVTEQEVQAVEDQALREVALGGPDTAARTRLMQHIVAVPTNDDTCAAVLKDWNSILKPLGLALNPDTFALDFDAALQVSFYPPAGPADPCCPPAQGGYLGADNQLVRVTVTSYNPTSHTGTLLWGWNNASFLYRATLVDATANPPILTLSPAPVDSEHTPQINQVIEVLRSTMELGNPADLNFIAAPEGEVITLASAGTVFDPTTNQLTLPAGTIVPSDTNPLFVRLWQAEVPFTDGEPAQLDTVSGLAVTIHMTALPSGPLEARPFWDFAVRPNTPQLVYPQRYLQAPQGPTGPRRWLTDLAIVKAAGVNPITGAAGGTTITIVADCRVPFGPLPGQGDDCGCCCITLNAAEVAARGGLQAVVDAQAKIGQSLSLRPGRYVLEAPLALTKAHAGFVLSGCSPGGLARLSVDPAAVANFPNGMITITGTTNIVIQGLSFATPVFPAPNLLSTIGGTAAITADVTVGIGIDKSTSIVIEDCTFLLPSPAAPANQALLYIGAGIYAAENCSGLRVLRNRFESLGGGTIDGEFLRLLIGIWSSPSALNTTGTQGTISGANPAQPKAKSKSKASAEQAAAGFVNLPVVNDQLDDVEITDNRFTGMSLAVLVMAELGMIRCNDNRAINCCGGFWFVDTDLAGNVAFGQAALADEKQGNNLASAQTARLFMQPVLLANAVNFSAALRPAAAVVKQTPAPAVSDEARTILLADSSTRGQAAYTAFVAGATTDPNNPAPPAAAKGKRAQPAAAAPPALSDADYANANTAYASLQAVGVAREVNGTTVTPAIYIRDNEALLVPYDTTTTTGTTPETSASLQGIRCALAVNTDTGALIVSGNHVEAANGSSIAFSAEWASNVVVNGNLFNQPRIREKAAQPCVVIVTTGNVTNDNDLVAISGNIVNTNWSVQPPRSTPTPNTADWKFLNTVI
jgi:hypothetical protein